MRQGRLRDLTPNTRLRAPVPERRPHAVGNARAAEATQQKRHRRFPKRPQPQPGKTKPSPFPSAFAWSSTLRAPEDNGTQCSRPDLVRSSGIVQTADSRSNSAHPPHAPRRFDTPYKHQHLQREFRAGERGGRAHPLQRRRNLAVRQSPRRGSAAVVTDPPD